MSWIFLFIAGLLEIIWAIAMKQSHGFTRVIPSAIMLTAMAGSFGLLALAMRTLPLGTAYMVWTGIGALGAFVAGIVFFSDQLSAARVLAAMLIFSGMIVMKLS
ncbi:DMT family transporter [Rhizobium paknamense]|uniref:Guanidinium exporter n=1 Tax=Rhizobium paknamense TaxID=1206817 RepID=A0ABU0I9M1_9HYPH|nr:SMR family transporter [Rhizobium paknamense]MDQ0453966.1 quaternary ammonium compound-resistance protein SugE [Rhizobium paknamense]